jgi:uncharacterized phage protein (TIGR01671 family)
LTEIKFRAWNKIANKFSYFGNREPEITTADVSNSSSVGMFLRSKEIYLTPYEDPQQFKGLKDKNSIDIYSGDIVLFNGNHYYIQYEIGSFMLVRCDDKTDMYDQFENCWNDDVYPLSQFYWENNCDEDYIYELEVVGNIYQNKELLK